MRLSFSNSDSQTDSGVADCLLLFLFQEIAKISHIEGLESVLQLLQKRLATITAENDYESTLVSS